MKYSSLILLAALHLAILSGCSEKNDSLTGPSAIQEARGPIYVDLGTTIELTQTGLFGPYEYWEVLHISNENSVELIDYTYELVGCGDGNYAIECISIQTWKYLAKEKGVVKIIYGEVYSCESCPTIIRSIRLVIK